MAVSYMHSCGTSLKDLFTQKIQKSMSLFIDWPSSLVNCCNIVYKLYEALLWCFSLSFVGAWKLLGILEVLKWRYKIILHFECKIHNIVNGFFKQQFIQINPSLKLIIYNNTIDSILSILDQNASHSLGKTNTRGNL